MYLSAKHLKRSFFLTHMMMGKEEGFFGFCFSLPLFLPFFSKKKGKKTQHSCFFFNQKHGATGLKNKNKSVARGLIKSFTISLDLFSILYDEEILYTYNK
jgi:hypothetical protein